MYRLTSSIILAVTAMVITALTQTAIGKLVLVLIAAKIAASFGVDFSSTGAVVDFAKENPMLAAEYALDWIL